MKTQVDKIKYKMKLIDKVTEARIIFSDSQPWLGTLVSKLDFLLTSDERFQTAATDGKKVYFRDKFVESLGIPELVFVIGHELLHCILDHFTRKDGRDAHIWNVACDYAVNGLLSNYKVGSIPSIALFNKKFSKLTAEEIYEKIKNDAKRYGGESTLDDHEVLEKDESVDWGEELAAAGATEQKRGSLGEEIVKQYRGTRRSAKQNNNTEWRSILRNYVREKIKNDVTYLRPNRKTQAQGIVIPSQINQDVLTIALAIDTSGSIDNKMVEIFLNEVDQIFTAVENLTLHLWCFDTAINNYKIIEVGQLGLLLDYKPSGGGGTSYEENWRHMTKQDIQPDLFIMLTDGYPGGGWGNADYCDTIFAIYGSETIIAPFGETIYIK